MLIVLLLVGVTGVVVALEPRAETLWRHLYLAPVVIAGLRFGAATGMLTAFAAVLLFGPVVLREIERAGATRAVLDGLVTFAVLLLAGVVTGTLASRARRQRKRYDAVLAAQRAVAEAAPLAIVLARLRAALEPRLDAASLGLAHGERRSARERRRAAGCRFARRARAGDRGARLRGRRRWRVPAAPRAGRPADGGRRHRGRPGPRASGRHRAGRA